MDLAADGTIKPLPMWMLAWVPKTQSPVLGVPIADDRALFRGRMMAEVTGKSINNLEAAATAYARRMEAAYINKRGGRVPVNAALGIYIWAYDRFIANPEIAD